MGFSKHCSGMIFKGTLSLHVFRKLSYLFKIKNKHFNDKFKSLKYIKLIAM